MQKYLDPAMTPRFALCRPAARCGILGSVLLSCAIFGAEEASTPDLIERLNLEAHGSVSFGYLRSWGNDWIGDGSGGSSENGTTDLWEATANVIARPADRLRLGAQVFARDLGRYDNGNPTLDWAYLDYRFADACGIQVGRVKFPLGLYNETADIDAARTPVILPPSIYSFRSRDLRLSVDGLKIFGYIPLHPGAIEYAVYGGVKRYPEEAGFSQYVNEATGADPGSLHIQSDALIGASVHWHTPLEGLGLRISVGDILGFQVDSTYSGVPARSVADNNAQGIASVIWEKGPWEVACEYSRLHARGTVTLAGNEIRELRSDSHAAHLSTTWHGRPWLDLYGSLQVGRRDAGDVHGPGSDSVVFAVRVLPLPEWSLKAEVRLVHGTQGVNPQPAGSAPEENWQVFSIKSTWDF